MTALPPVGSIGLTQVRGLTGLLIRLGQWLNGDGTRNFEHAFMLTAVDPDGTAWIVEAEPHVGVRETVLSKYRGRRVLWLICPEQFSFEVVTAARSYVGIHYSILDYFAIAAQRLQPEWVAPVLRWWVRRSQHQICSSMVDAAASQGGWELLRGGVWPGYVTPARLASLAPAGAVPQRIE